jgi:hypothetical protein
MKMMKGSSGSIGLAIVGYNSAQVSTCFNNVIGIKAKIQYIPN